MTFRFGLIYSTFIAYLLCKNTLSDVPKLAKVGRRPFILAFSDGTEWNRSSTASNVQSGNLLSVGKYNVILWKTTDDNLQPNYVPSIVFRSVSSEKEWNNSPNYAVLVDIRSVNSNAPQVGYVVQENLELVTNTRILHPLLDSYFENYVNGRYVMRPWLENVYPLDDRKQTPK
uniref:Hemimethylated DNA-binding domain-containing protein n=1 Tax=Romanomermis culicivorax TaxID=13658 RepID=A0A915J0W3_ROMCU